MTPKKRKRLFEIAEENAEELYSANDAEGLWVRKENLPSDLGGYAESELETVLGAGRTAEIKSGQLPTEAELDALRKNRLASILRGDRDEDDMPAYCLAEVTDARGKTAIALILCTGSSFFGTNIWVDEVFDTREAALFYLKQHGWVS
jgi:hypothetical protein